jgi:hypothetical protein
MALGRRYNKFLAVKEADIEDYFVKAVDKIGGRAIKGNPRNQRGEADRFCFIPPGLAIIVELKRPGQQPRRNQASKLGWFRKNGFQATYLDTKAKVDAFITWVRNYQKVYRVRHINQVCVRVECPIRRTD